ncbi:MAG: YceI family protein [Saprospirales bacterium]|jgi:polyisoprenoid-binding protein YceI|nr:MAG: YceI family protein [Saprospirales bacterium]
MKNLLLILSLLFSVSIITAANDSNSESKTMSVVSSESTLYWKGYKVGGWHEGFVTIKDGHLSFDDQGNFNGGRFVIDMTTINTTDLTGNSAERLEGHLKSDDFFSVETYPEAHLNIKRVISRGEPGDYRIVADLTIKGITHEIRFNTLIEDKGNMKHAVAEFKVDRSLYDVRFGSGSFFANLGDNTIYDEFDIKVNLVVR